MASYSVNDAAVRHVEDLITKHQYVLDSTWSDAQPSAADENAYREAHGWDALGAWYLGLDDDANPETKARYGFVVGDLRRVHRSGLIAAESRAEEYDHHEVAKAARALLEKLDEARA